MKSIVSHVPKTKEEVVALFRVEPACMITPYLDDPSLEIVYVASEVFYPDDLPSDVDDAVWNSRASEMRVNMNVCFRHANPDFSPKVQGSPQTLTKLMAVPIA